MNATITHKPNVKGSVLDELAKGLPAIIAEAMIVPGGNLAIVLPEHVSLEFIQASQRDVGCDIRIKVFAKSSPRKFTENDRAKAILEKVIALITKSAEECSVDIHLYLMEIGAAKNSLG